MSVEGTATTSELLTGKVISIPVVDKTLTKENYSADAKVVGDKFTEIAEKITTKAVKVVPTDEEGDGYVLKVEGDMPLFEKGYPDGTSVGAPETYILHTEQTKCSGSYSGGSLVKTKYLGSIGKLMMVYCDEFTAFVNPLGAFKLNTDGTTEWVTTTTYTDGVFTRGEGFDDSGTTYYYQVI